ncbi:hypothetical protein SynPROS91_00988 [Synechococcus sp. PROS-9-1]|nr:hypothetical protein SynPROS91_00988 [Synechococcus sp. PROS-9-1]
MKCLLSALASLKTDQLSIPVAAIGMEGTKLFVPLPDLPLPH